MPDYFYPRPLRRGRPPAAALAMAPFLSTPSSQRATGYAVGRYETIVISIHALFAEGDAVIQRQGVAVDAFLSTPSSQRATLRRAGRSDGQSVFLSTPSSQRATLTKTGTTMTFKFLSTPSSQRATHALLLQGSERCNFYPRPLRRGRRRLGSGFRAIF